MRKGTPFSEAYPAYLSQWHPSNVLTPNSVAPSSNKKIVWQCADNPAHTWEASPNARFKSNGGVTGCPKCSGREVDPGRTDLLTMFPVIAAQWSSRNVLKASEVAAFSNKKFWWEGTCGHTWDAAVITRTRQGDGCPYCSGHRVLEGLNDVASQFPDLVPEWRDERDPRTVYIGSRTKVAWYCGKGHVWETSVAKRTSGVTCHYCSGRKVLEGFNDLASQRPDLAAMWHPSNRLTANEVSVGSGFKAKWVCSGGHVFDTQVVERTSSVTLCPVCEGTVLVKGVTDFATQHPELAKQWVGGKKRPDEVRSMSIEMSQWKCDNGHPPWEAPFSRRARGHGCPYCAGQRAITGVNDLESTFPAVAREWHPDNGVSPSTVSRASSVPYRWVCSEGHEWTVSPNQRTSHREGVTNCPECFARTNSVMETDLADFVARNYHGEIIRRHRLGRLELDVYLPSEQIAIEFNGVYWHSDALGKRRDRHLRKVEACRASGIRLIQVWEDDWRDRRAVVESLLLRKMGVDKSPAVGARTASVTEIAPSDARKFLVSNHIQGFVGGTHYDALVSKGGTVLAVMVTTHLKSCVRIDRYATSGRVQGGFSRLLKVVSRRAASENYTSLITFSDNEISDGDLYLKHGFEPVNTIAPDYKYLYRASRIHKFSFRKNRFRKDANLHYDPTMTEAELSKLNNLPRIWDSGKIKWEYALAETDPAHNSPSRDKMPK